MIRRLAATFVGVLLAIGGAHARQSPQPQLPSWLPFESYLESARQQAGIPGLSALIVLDGEVAWERGFGYQNAESRIRATPDTPYLVADLSQTVAAALLMQCVEWRILDLDQPVRRYGLATAEANTTLRQLLSHTATGAFRYEPERFAQLTSLMEICAPQPYRKSVSHRILEHLAMRDSVPGRDLQDPSVVPSGQYDPSHLERYQRVLERLAVPYRVDQRKRLTRTEVPVEGISAAAGMVSTARDLAQETFIAAYEHLGRESAAFAGYSGVDTMEYFRGLREEAGSVAGAREDVLRYLRPPTAADAPPRKQGEG